MEQERRLEKSKLRNRILAELKSQKEEDRIKKSRQIEKQLFNLPEFKQARIIMFYVSTKFEVNTHDMIKKAIKLGKKVAVPVVSTDTSKAPPLKVTGGSACARKGSPVDKMDASLISGQWQLQSGPYNIRQPKEEHRNIVSPKELDLIIVPGVAFDDEGNRLGRGKGYYDRFLQEKSDKTRTLGLAFSFQIVNNLPFSRHDHPVEIVISA